MSGSKNTKASQNLSFSAKAVTKELLGSLPERARRVLSDRFGLRGPLATYYFVRGLSLIFLLYVWNVPSLHLWAVIFGLNYISTVPPTTALTAKIFGRYSVGELTGWTYFCHQVGAAFGAALAGWLYESTGSYSSALVSGALLGFVAAALTLAIREEPVVSGPTPAPAPATS